MGWVNICDEKWLKDGDLISFDYYNNSNENKKKYPVSSINC